MAMERAALQREAERLQAESFRLSLDRDASNDVFNRRHVSRLPPLTMQGTFSTRLGQEPVTCLVWIEPLRRWRLENRFSHVL